MKAELLACILLAGIFFSCNTQPKQTINTTFVSEKPAKLSKNEMQWFTDAKFGMFIHWGPYSIFEGAWKGRQVPVGENAEWIMQKLQIPVNEYRKVAETFNPVHFSADEWTELARTAGMKYLVITAKHHDGFAMYDSDVSDYNIVDYTPYGKDPMKELSAACAEKNIRFCFYYSHREDWDEPYAYGNFWVFETSKQNGYEYESEKAEYFENYLEKKAKPQLKELLTNYGPLGLIWFDRGMYTPEQGYEFIKIIRDIQPKCLVNGRVGNYNLELIGDYQNLSDNGIPTSGVDEYWETPQTLNETWGFSRFDTLWKSPAEVIHRLAEIVSKGGNYLLNIGPKADGTIPSESVEILKEVGKWMEKNSESIYQTTASPLAWHNWGFCTAKDSTLYLHITRWPQNNVVQIDGLITEISAAKTVYNKQNLVVQQNGGHAEINLEGINPDLYNTVIKLELAGLPEVVPLVIPVEKNDTIILDNMTVTTFGKTKKRYNRLGELFISKWNTPQDKASWTVSLKEPGKYKVAITYSVPVQNIGVKYLVQAGNQVLELQTLQTGKEFDFKTFSLGEIAFENTGIIEINVFPAEMLTNDFMYFKSLVFEPVNPE